MAGFQIQMTVRGILVYDITSDAFITGVVSAGFAPSLLLFSMFGGVLGEKVNKKRLIQFAQCINVIQSIIIATLLYFNMVHWSLTRILFLHTE